MIYILISSVRFRSTGSYEPDLSISILLYPISGFDPQALTSLTLSRFIQCGPVHMFRSTGSYEPDRKALGNGTSKKKFRSTGSYEPDQQKFMVLECFLHYFLFKSSKYDI